MSMPSDEIGPLFEGRFSDGRTAGAGDVHVRLTSRGIEITVPGADQPLVWPYGALAAAEPLTAHSIDALVTYEHMPGATLFVPEGTFARRLAVEAPHLTAKAQRWRHARPWLWASAAAILIGCAVWLSDLSPSRAIARMLPDGAREKLGAQVVQSMTNGRKMCEESDGRAALDVLIKRLSEAAGAKKDFKVVVVDWGLMNAFATPGEQIVLTRGIIKKASSADEIAGVLAHEMGHGIEMHPETGIVRGLGLAAATELLLGGGGGTLANFGVLLAQLSYTRDAEREADGHALRILKAASISASGLADFFKRVLEIEDKTPGAKTMSQFDLLRTHPDTEKRRHTVLQQPQYPATPALSGKQWEALKSICKGTTPEPPVDL